METKSVPHWKWVLAGCGAATILVGIGLAVWFLTTLGAAQQGPSELTLHPERQNEIVAGRRAETLAQRIGLTPEQQQELGVVLADFAAARAADREDNAGNLFALMQARRAAMSEMDARVAAMLTPEQSTKYAEMKSEIFGRIGQLQQLRPLLGDSLPPLSQGFAPQAPSSATP